VCGSANNYDEDARMSSNTRFSILIVEDDALIATDLCRELQDYGFRVVGVASSYDEAISLATADPPKVACVDIRIKGSKDGIVLARALREQGVRVVMITGNPDLLTPEMARHAVIKPFHPQSVLAEIRAAAKEKPETAATAPEPASG
jgi:DNA-binding response OmpR family regulator